MQLTRNNYEEYFLLYADGELTSTEMKAVEQFVKLHPDLGDELDLLKETVLQIDGLVEMPGKELLLKPVQWNEEELTPNQQDLLLYLDNELPAAKKESITKQLETDIALQNDYKSLQKTVLVTAVVAMPEKEKLYRHEKDRKPIPMQFVRWMAAAAVIAGLGWFGLSVWNNQPATNVEMASNKTTEKTNKAVVPNTNKERNYEAGAVKENSLASNGNDIANTVATKEVALKNTATNQQSAGNISKNNEAVVIKNMPQQMAAVLPEPTVDIPTQSNNPMAKVSTPVIDEAVGLASLNNTGSQVAKYSEPDNSPAFQHAAYADNSSDEDEYVSIAGARISKQKLRGVFRNVTRTVSRGFDKSTVTQASVSSL